MLCQYVFAFFDFFPPALDRGDDRESCKEERFEKGADVAKQERLASRVSAAYEVLHSYITSHVNYPQNHLFKIFIKS